jgi:hypothetical protein
MYTKAQLQPLLDAIERVLNNEDNAGCSDDLTVISLSACNDLRTAVDALPKVQILHLGMHDHRHGVSTQMFLVPEGFLFNDDRFKELLVEDFEPDLDESLRVLPIADNEVWVIRLHDPKACIRVEFDLAFFGGDYDAVGDFAYVPLRAVDEHGSVVDAFKALTGHNPQHIIHFSEDELYTADGEEYVPDPVPAQGAASDPVATADYIGAVVSQVRLPNGSVVPIDAEDKIETSINVTVYDLEKKGETELDEFLSEQATGRHNLLSLIEHFVESRDATGGLTVTVTGIIDRDIATDEGHSFAVNCQKCDSPLQVDGFCPDATCPYSNWPQNVQLDDLNSMTKLSVEGKYGIKKHTR